MRVVRYRIKILLKHVIHVILHNPLLKNRLLPIVKHFPNFYVRLKRIQYLGDNRNVERIGVVLSEEGLAIYRELVAVLKSSGFKSGSDS